MKTGLLSHTNKLFLDDEIKGNFQAINLYKLKHPRTNSA